MNNEKPLRIDKQAPICTLSINNPKKRNALTAECLLKIAETFSELTQDDGVRVVILRGEGDEAFSAGADITTMPGRGEDGPSGVHEALIAASRAVQDYPFPVIAMLNGYTLGAGCILAVSCDIRVAADHVRMGVPTSKMGLLSGHETFGRFFTLLGYATALEVFLTGRFYEARECLGMGLVNHVVGRDRLETYTYDLAREITECAPLSLQGSKLILSEMARSLQPSPEGLEVFNALRERAFKSEDHQEARQAFLEKRKPRFRGR